MKMTVKIWRYLRQWAADLKIRNKLFISFLLLNFIPLSIIGILTYEKSRSLIQAKTNDYTNDLLKEVSRNIEANMQSIDRFYYSIFTNNTIRQALHEADSGRLDQAAYLSAGTKVSNLLYGDMAFQHDVEAIDLVSLKKLEFQAGNVPVNRDLSRKDWAGLKHNLGNLIWLTPPDRKDVVLAASAIYDVDTLKKIGYFVLYYKETKLYDTFSETKLNEQGRMFIVDQDGRIISGKNKVLLHTKLSIPNKKRLLEGGMEGDFSERIDGVENIVSYHMIGRTGWRLVSMIPTANYAEMSTILKKWMIFLFIIFFLLALGLSYLLSNSISKPIRRLSETMKIVDRDRFSVGFKYNSRSEIGVLSRNFNRMLQRIDYLINQVYQEELMKQKTQLKYLMFQINPHFLFNTLETINWMARIRGVPDVGKISKALGDLMREGIKGKEFVPLGREIENLNKYIYIQQLRYGDKFHLRLDVPKNILAASVPNFILQPLVENAIVHGMEMKMEQGQIEVRGREENGNNILSVTDDGEGMDDQALVQVRKSLYSTRDEGDIGIGLVNVHRRIQLYYGKSYGLSVDSTIGVGTTVCITLPK